MYKSVKCEVLRMVWWEDPQNSTADLTRLLVSNLGNELAILQAWPGFMTRFYKPELN